MMKAAWTMKATSMNDSQPKLLNLGCGSTFHPAWINIDLVACDPLVIEHDLTNGIPCDENSCDAVYHSHVLEHLTPQAAREMLTECFRVLKPGGTLRIAVPDLEQIARTYLQTLDVVEHNDPVTMANHQWMQFELIDQLVRSTSGGEMGRYMSQQQIVNQQFLRARMGDEFLNCRSVLVGSDAKQDPNAPARKRLGTRAGFKRLRDKIARFLLKRSFGDAAWEQFQEARFRSRGEIHRWMYDRISLSRLLLSVGFAETAVASSEESGISDFSRFELDSSQGKTRKPDSLFMEARKNATALNKLQPQIAELSGARRAIPTFESPIGSMVD